MTRPLRRVLALACALAATLALATPSFDALPDAERRWLESARALWPQLAPADRDALRAHARHWDGLDAAGRRQVTRAARAWDALPAPERARRRARFADWANLDDGEHALLRGAAAKFEALPLLQQQALRRRFAALPAEAREEWRLGPTLGPQMSGLRPLFEFVPSADQSGLLAAVRELPPGLRADLGRVLPGLSPGRRQALRAELQAAPAGTRAGVVARWAAANGAAAD
jgi:hypothetical protein